MRAPHRSIVTHGCSQGWWGEHRGRGRAVVVGEIAQVGRQGRYVTRWLRQWVAAIAQEEDPTWQRRRVCGEERGAQP